MDPLAASGGQDRYSPYAAMGNQPESMIDPNGTKFFGASHVPIINTRFGRAYEHLPTAGRFFDEMMASVIESSMTATRLWLAANAAERAEQSHDEGIRDQFAELIATYGSNSNSSIVCNLGSPGGGKEGGKRGIITTAKFMPDEVSGIDKDTGEPATYEGVDVILTYEEGDYDEYQWYQSVTLGAGESFRGKTGQYRDVNSDRLFYYRDEKIEEQRSEIKSKGLKYDTWFDDFPKMLKGGVDFHWTFETVLVGRNKGQDWNIIKVATWGISRESGTIQLTFPTFGETVSDFAKKELGLQ